MEEEFQCPVCRLGWDIDSVRMLECQHTVCMDCLEGTLIQALSPENTEGVIQKLKCPHKWCPGKIDKFIVMQNFPKLFEAYSRALSGRALIDCMKEDELIL